MLTGLPVATCFHVHPTQRGLLRSVHRQSSAVNLASMSRLGKDAEIRRLQEELRSLREDFKVCMWY